MTTVRSAAKRPYRVYSQWFLLRVTRSTLCDFAVDEVSVHASVLHVRPHIAVTLQEFGGRHAALDGGWGVNFDGLYTAGGGGRQWKFAAAYIQSV